MTGQLPAPLMLTPHLDAVGGTERQCLLLASAMHARGVHTAIVTHRRGGSARAAAVGLTVHRVDHPVHHAATWLKRVIRGKRSGTASNTAPQVTRGAASWSAARAFRETPNRLLEGSIERLVSRELSVYSHVHLHGTFWFPMVKAAARAARAAGRPLLIKIANEPSRVFAQLEADPIALDAVLGADALVAVSRESASYLEARKPRGRVVYIPNAVELPAAVPSDRQRGNVLFVGTLKPQKGVDVLIEAWSLLGPTAPKLSIVGDGPERSALERRARELGVSSRTEFAGTRGDVGTLLRSARAFVLPSRWEGMPNALLEAMSWGLPCVATDIGGATDLVTDGVEGLIAPPGDAAALAARISRLLTDDALAAALGAAARKKAQTTYGIDAAVDAYLSLYGNLDARRS